MTKNLITNGTHQFNTKVNNQIFYELFLQQVLVILAQRKLRLSETNLIIQILRKILKWETDMYYLCYRLFNKLRYFEWYLERDCMSIYCIADAEDNFYFIFSSVLLLFQQCLLEKLGPLSSYLFV